MFEITQESLLQFFSSYAYEPATVYLMLVGLMFASSFGFPAPEEITLVSAGLVAYFAQQPELYPPPAPGMEPLNPVTLAVVAFVAVFLSDFA